MSKWVHEIILENIPPFSWLPRGYNVALQMFLMEIVGASIAISLSLPYHSILFGSLAILVISLWSFLIYHIGLTIHQLEPPSAPLEREVIEQYQKSLFSRRHYELHLAVSVLAFLLFYLSFFKQSLVSYWLGGNFSPALLFLVVLILWDISYRIGVGLWSAILAFKRSISLLRVSKMRTKMRYTAYRELKTLKRMDFINLVFGLVTLLLYPLFSFDITFFAGLLVYATAILLFSAASLLVIERIPGLPGEVLWLLDEGRVGYVGTSDKNMQPHLTPVIFVFVGNSLFFVVSKISRKLKNIHENNKISFLIDFRDENNLYNNRAVLFMGKAKVYSPLDAVLGIVKLLKVRNAFYKKYPEYVYKYKKEEQKLPLAWRTTLFISRILVKLETEKIMYWREARPIRLPLGE